MNLRSAFRKGLRWIVGNGESISFWFDNWIFNNALVESSSIPIGSEDLKVSHFIDQDGQWDVSLLRQFVPIEISNSIANYFLPSNECNDTRVWGLAPDGNYSVESGVELLLPTKKRLELSHVFLPMECVFCNHHSEDSAHMFSKCPFTIDVFAELQVLLKWHVPPEIEDGVPFYSFLLSLKSSFSMPQVECMAIVWWFVWYARNGVIFRQDSSSPQKVSHMVKAFAHNLSVSGVVVAGVDSSVSISARKKAKVNIRDQVVWSPPPGDYFKLNFDGSKLASGQAAFGFVIRDSAGIVRLCGAGTLDEADSILEAEARGLREGIRGARFLGIGKLIVEGDNLAVINAIKRIWKIPWMKNSIILDTVQDMGQFEDVKFVMFLGKQMRQRTGWLIVVIRHLP
ncbi:uncharacterized protein LOC125496718 [Beta vulgaris subsp. vulgaris]|uniref:uncharacterized protein LOC125496718 n=1 Tax=Beta vulgaris subsp. vulgaris TaxID=3555 RepID=UPI0020371237|nr:uncharacterized protein LOC125496718 [Beta vulgaris subsp. vulgaris]